MLIPKLTLAARGPYTFWRVASILVVGAMMASAGFTFFFIYENMYNALTNAVVIEKLSSSVNTYVVDLPRFYKTQALLEKKNERITLPPDLRNIFAWKEASVPYATSTKKK